MEWHGAAVGNVASSQFPGLILAITAGYDHCTGGYSGALKTWGLYIGVVSRAFYGGSVSIYLRKK